MLNHTFFDDKVVKRLSPLVHLRMMTTLRLLVILRPTSLVHENLRILRGWYWADDEDESHITVDKSPESDDKFRFSLNANGGCIWYDYDAGTWKSYSGITKYELNANILIIKDSYSSGDETDWQTCKRFKIVSIKGNTMVCTVCLMDEDDTELTFTKR